MTGITLTPSKASDLPVGDVMTLTVSPVPAGASLGTVTAVSGTPASATTSVEHGTDVNVTAVAAGTSDITVTAGGKSKAYTVTVVAASA